MKQLKHSKIVHRLIRFLHLQQLARGVLKRLAPKFKLGNITYRILAPESFSVANEMFRRPTYRRLLDCVEIRTFVDLGCNTGFLACLLASQYGASLIEGVLVDANPDMVEESWWHLKRNGMAKCKALCAVVGPETKVADFFVSDFSIASSNRPFGVDYPFPIDAAKKLTIPVVSVRKLIFDEFGDRRINLLKIDIEGSELDLLNSDISYFDQIDWIVIEWHKWVLSQSTVQRKLSENGFDFIMLMKDDEICGLALFENIKSPNKFYSQKSFANFF